MRRRTGDSLFARVLLVFLAAVAAGGVRAGEEEDPALKIEEIRNRLAASYDRIAHEYLNEQSREDRPKIALVIGALFEVGKLGDPNPAKAMEYYAEAAKLGSADAECALANIYGMGAPEFKIPRDPARARSMYERAAAGGSTRAMLELGRIYTDGKDVTPDSKKGLEYYLEAARRGEPAALDKLEPVMRKAREWEESHPGKSAGFPTGTDDVVDKGLTQQNIDVQFALGQLASHTFVEISRRIAATMKKSQSR